MLKEKTWTLKQEEKIADEWLKQEPYKFDSGKAMKAGKKIYSIDTPPPYVNTPVHIGQALTYCYMDYFARYKRAKGFSVLFPLGLDRNGLPIELAAEKKFDIRAEEVGRKKFLGYCKKILEEASDISIKTFVRLGISFNSYKFGDKVGEGYYTDGEDYRRLTQETFIDLWNKGLIYEERKVSNYCPGCKTTIADAEITYEDRDTEIYYLKFEVEEGKDIAIATTRPELLCSCSVVLFNPDDKRYKALAGKHAITPLYEKEVPIKPHPIAKPEFGSGLVMMCSFGDLTDIRFYREEGLHPIIAIGTDGKMNKNSDFLEGMEIKEARKEILKRLREEGLLIKTEKTTQRAPICERSKDNIEFIALEEYYLKQIEFKEEVRKIAGKIDFYDKSSKQILLDWINTVSEDWPLSRRRYYATPIPLWKCNKCGEIILGKKGKYWEPWKESPKEKCKCGGKFIGETRVFDTWFDSSITPLYILGYWRYDSFFKKAYPCTLRPQGKEIIRTWLYYTLLRGYQLTKKPAFADVWINFHVVDADGRKMSKRLGNAIDPLKIIEKHGSEAFRLWAAIEGNITKQDLRCSEDRISAEFKTLIKLWNITRFITMFQLKGQPRFTETDKLIMNYMNDLIDFADKKYSEYNFFEPAHKVRHFLWEIFASHYLELIKTRAYNSNGKFSKAEQNGAIFTLYYCLQKMLLLLAPIIPLITSSIYQEVFKKNVHEEEFPKSSKRYTVKAKLERLMEVNSQIWKAKKDKGLSLKTAIKKIELPQKYKDVKGLIEDLKAAHNAELIVFSSVKEMRIKF